MFDPNGTFLRTWGTSATGPASSIITGIAVAPNGTVYVTEPSKFRVQYYQQRRLSRSLGQPGAVTASSRIRWESRSR